MSPPLCNILVETESESDAGGDEASREELQSKIKRQADEIEYLKGEKNTLYICDGICMRR